MPKRIAPITLVLVSFLLMGAQQAPPPQGAQQAPPPQAASGQNAAPKKPMLPDTFTNLRVLPTNISKRDLLSMMKAMSIGLQVRCSHCHVATDDLSEADFASDEKPTKVAAREMLRTLFEVRMKYPASPDTPAKQP